MYKLCLSGCVIVSILLALLVPFGAMPATFPAVPSLASPPSAFAASAIPAPIRSAADESVSATRDAEPTTYTDDAGHYRFRHLPHGTHKVTLDPTTLPLALRPAVGEAVPSVWVNPGQQQTSDALASGVRFTAAYDQETGDISGLVFLDQDGDGLQGPGEVGLAGVTVIDPNVHQYFVPFDDRDLMAIFRVSNTCQGSGIPVGNLLTSGVSLVASSNGTVYYYDYWEDGYDPDPLHPQPGSSTITGTLNDGQTRLFTSTIDISTTPWGSQLYYGGRDRITIVGEDATVMRYAYPTNPNISSMFAGAWDVEQTAHWGTEYIIPAGEDWGPRSDFEFTGASIMAMQSNTQVYLNGVLTATLDMGQTFFVNGDGPGPGGLNNGDMFTATAPIMVNQYSSICDLTNADGPWSGDSYTLEPVAHWTSDYWSPVPSRVGRTGCNPADTDIFVYNDNPVTITVTVDDGNPVNILLPPRSSSSVRTLLGRSFSNTNGVHLYTPGGERFWGVFNFDTRNTDYEWSFALVHDPSPRVMLAWAPGNALVPPSAQTPNPNGNLAWVTALTDTVVFVDLNGDGIPDQVDCNGNGTATDLNVDGICNEPTSNLGIALPQGRTLRIAHPVAPLDPSSADLTGALIYTRNYNEKIIAAWGEDSCVASAGLPYLDLGYTVLPLTSHSLAITKTAQPSPVPAGGVLTYTLAWSVSGHVPAPDVTISDTVPANTTLITATLPVTVNGTLLTWPLGPHLPGDSGFVTFTVRVASTLFTGTQIVNSALISDSTGISETNTITTPVISAHTLAIAKTGSPSPVAPGNLLTYTLAWNVSGDEPAPDVTIHDTVPPSTTFRSCGPLPCGLSGGTVVWPLGTFNPPASGVATLTVQVDSSVSSGAFILNSVIISDSTGITDTDTITTPVQSYGDVAITKSDYPDPVIPGTQLTYMLVVTNNGPITATGVVVTDTLPPQVTFLSAAPVPSSPAGANPITWSLGTLLPLEVRWLTVTTQVQSWVTQTFTNSAVVGSLTPDNNPLNNRDDEPTTPLLPGLVLVKSVTPGQGVHGQPFTYTLRITNTGPITFSPLALTDTLPPSFYYMHHSGVPRDPDVIAEPLLHWNDLGPLVPGASIAVSFAVTTATGITGTYTNTALVEGTTPTGVLTDTDKAPVVLHDPEVAIQKRIADYDLTIPTHITFAIAITNVGTSVIDVLPLVDTYDPYYLSFVEATPAPDKLASGSLTWYDLTVPPPHGFNRNLPPGAGFVITTVFTVAHDIGVTWNTAVVTRGIDIYNNPTNRVTGTVPIVDIPTAIELLYFRADSVSGREVRLAWATAVGIDNLGFYLYRADTNDRDRAELIHFEPAAPQGRQLGATYTYVDTVPSDGVWWYWLANVDTNGREAIFASTRFDGTLPNRIYLPVVVKSP
jgi:uncharacterized repeat protein (TIGR01451 family)